MPYPFLSDEWIEEVHAIRTELHDKGPAVTQEVRMNLVVTDLPFGDGDLQAHLDTTSGRLTLDKGHLTGPDLTVTVDYETAKTILVDGNPQAGMQAFMAGRIRVEGDVAKLLALQSVPPDERAHELAERLRAITE